MTCGIYKVTNQLDGTIYIGQSINIFERWEEHLWESCKCSEEVWQANRRHIQTHFHRALRKYGEENFLFEILEECSPDALDEREIHWISEYEKQGVRLYNMTKGGDGQRGRAGELAPGAKLTQAQADIIKKALKERKDAKAIQELVPIATPTMISSINYGKTWFDPNETYPISINNGHRTWSADEAMELKRRYAKGETAIQLATEQHVTLDTMSNMLAGKSYKDLPVLSREVEWTRIASNRKFSDEQVREWRQRVANGESISSVHKTCGVKCNYAAFYNMIKRITYKNVL